jgi:hypothetical protein
MQALVMAQQQAEKHLKQILNCTRGIVFLATPHHGSGLAHWAESLAKTIGMIKQSNPEILAVLKSESEVLERVQGGFHTMIRSRFRDGLPPIEITCFYEELPLSGVGIVSVVEVHFAEISILTHLKGRTVSFCHFARLHSNWNPQQSYGHDQVRARG